MPPQVRRRWSVLTPVILTACGALLATSYINSAGEDLRPTRYTDLASLVRGESDAVDRLNTQADELRDEVDRLTGQIDNAQVRRLRREAEDLRPEAGFTSVTGPAVTVSLSDAPAEHIDAADPELRNDMVVHQQDLQAVVNAMWNAGAEAVVLQGERIISTTGIKCHGNSVMIQGRLYAQPYVVTAIGDQAAILQSLEYDSYLQNYRAYADSPTYDLGWALETEAEATAPAYAGVVGLSKATPMPDPDPDT